MFQRQVARSLRGVSSHCMNKDQLEVANQLVREGFGTWLYGHVFAEL